MNGTTRKPGLATLSAQQQAALVEIEKWRHKRDPQVFRLDGYAGTGKTTLARQLRGKGVLYAAYTGKAAHVLRSKGCTPVSTIHSLIYEFDREYIDRRGRVQPRFVLSAESDLQDASLLVVDEVSMVNRELGEDLLSYGVPTLVIGDPAQLPPIEGGGYFNQFPVDVMLTEIHRQAAGSPVLNLATRVRSGEQPRHTRMHRSLARKYDQVIVGTNKKRWWWINYLRDAKGFDLRGGIGDRLICLQNNQDWGIYNGQTFTINGFAHKDTALILSDGDEEYSLPFHPEPFLLGYAGEQKVRKLPFEYQKENPFLTYAQAITCHKAQGSEWGRVLVIDESAVFSTDRSRWLYTAITRASGKVTVCERDLHLWVNR